MSEPYKIWDSNEGTLDLPPPLVLAALAKAALKTGLDFNPHLPPEVMKQIGEYTKKP